MQKAVPDAPRPGRDPGFQEVYQRYEASRRRKAGVLDLSSVPSGPTVTHLDLDLTLACNLRCTYCFKVKDNEHQDLQIALDSVTWLIYASGDAEEITIALIGGEPMVRFKELKQIVPFAKRRAAQHGKRIHFSMTTNGTIVNDEILEFFDRWGIGFHTSIDGHAEVQDTHRRFAGGKGSSDVLHKNLPRILGVRPDTCARSTVMPDTAGEMVKSFDYFRSLGYTNMAFVPGAPDDWDDDSIELLRSEFDRLADRVIDTFRSGERVVVKYIDEMCSARAKGQTKKPLPCGVGRGMLLADINGDLWPCHRWSKNGSDWKLGSLYDSDANNDERNEKRKVFYERDEPEKCHPCPARPICGGGCPAENLEETGDLWDRHENSCRMDALLASTGARVYETLSGEQNETFLQAYPPVQS